MTIRSGKISVLVTATETIVRYWCLIKFIAAARYVLYASDGKLLINVSPCLGRSTSVQH